MKNPFEIGNLVTGSNGLLCGQITGIKDGHLFIKPIIRALNAYSWTRSGMNNIFIFTPSNCTKASAPKLDDICRYLGENWDKYGVNY